MRSRSGTGDDAKLHTAVQRVALIVGAAPHDVLPRADAGGLDARGGLARLRDEAPLDELRPPQREPLVVHLGAGAARVAGVTRGARSRATARGSPFNPPPPPQREPLVVHLGAGAARVPDDL